MSNRKFIIKTAAFVSLAVILSAGSALATPSIQNQVVVTTIAGDFEDVNDSTGPRLGTGMQAPHFIAIKPNGDLLVTGHSEIAQIGNTAAGLLSLFSGNPPNGAPNTDGVTLSAEHYRQLRGIAYDPFGYAWVADQLTGNILRIDEADPDNDGDNVRIMASVDVPFDLVSDQFGNIYWTDTGTDSLNVLSYLNPTYLPDLTSADIAFNLSLVSLGNPQGLAFSPDFTTLYVIDQGNQNIVAYYPDNNTTPGSGANKVVFTNVLVGGLTGITVGPDGSIYVTESSDDSPGNRIWKFAPPVNFGDTLLPPVVYAGDGTYDWNDGPALSAEFANPYGITSDAFGNLYVADHDDSFVRLITTVPDFTQFILEGDCNQPVIGAALNDIISYLVFFGDVTVNGNGIFNDPTLAALQAVSFLSSSDQAAFMASLLPAHIPGMLVATEFANNKIFNIQSMRSQSLHSRHGRASHAPASSNGGTSASYKDAIGGVWFEPMIAYLNRSEDCCNPNLQNHIDGITGGLDYSFYEDTIVGFSVGKIIDRIHYNYRTQKEMIDSYFVSPYASAVFGPAELELAGIYARNLNKVSHALTNGTVYHGKDQGNTWAGRAAMSVKAWDSKWLDFAPYGEVEYTSLQTGNHLQLPVDGLSFSVRRHTSAMLREEAGLMANLRMGERGSMLTVSGKVGYIRKDQITGGDIVLENSLIGDFQVDMKECAKNLLAVGAQVEYEVSPDASISASYEGELGDGYYGQSYTASVGGKIRF